MTGAGGVRGLQSAREVARARLSAKRSARAGRAAGVPTRPDPATAPLSPEQEGLWFVEQLGARSGTTGAYAVGKTVRLTGLLDLEMLQQAVDDVIDRHEALRTRIVERRGGPVQLIAGSGDPALDSRLEVIDLSSQQLDEAVALEQVEKLAAELAATPFPLDRAPMLRVAAFRLSETDHVLQISAHQLICDGQSMMIIIEEVGACYDARVRGRAPALPRLTVHFPDYAHWQAEQLAGELGERQRAYWAEQLADPPAALELPTDRPRPAAQAFAIGRHSVKPVRKLADKLKWFAAGQVCTVPMVMLAALNIVLTRYTGQTDIVVAMPVARRTRELQGAVGMFANTVALRTDTSGNPTVRELLARVRAVCTGAFQNADLSFDAAAATVERAPSDGHKPLFQVMFVPEEPFDDNPEPDTEGLGNRPVHLDHATAVVDLAWVAQLDDIATYVDYNTDLFDEPTIRQFCWHMRHIMEAVVAGPDQHIWDLPMLTEAERAQLA